MPVKTAGLQPRLALVVTHPSCWFSPGLAAEMLVLLSGSPPASGMCGIFFDVARQRCDRHMLPAP